jgi:hypothetical protein
MENIDHEGARSLGIEGSFLFLRVPLCALVVNIPVPGRFAYRVV